MNKLLYFLLAGCLFLYSCDGKNKDPFAGIRVDTLQPGQYQNPVFQPVFADPSIIRDPVSQKFYAYGTEDDWADGKGPRFVPVLESRDLIKWTITGTAFREKPKWKQQGYIWAPDINLMEDTYFMYYSFSTWGDQNPGVGLAVADKPEGPFKDRGKLFDSEEMEVPNSIDPYFYSSATGNYLFWGSFSDAPTQGTYAIELTADAKSKKPGAQKIKIAAGDFEAVTIHKKGEYYYFLGSKGACCNGEQSNYHVMMGRSKEVLGPYMDKEGRKLTDRGAGTLFLQGNSRFAGPGHTSNIITDKSGSDWIMYHAIETKNGRLSNGTTRRMLMLDRVIWQDDWPAIQGQSPSTTVQDGPKF